VQNLTKKRGDAAAVAGLVETVGNVEQRETLSTVSTSQFLGCAEAIEYLPRCQKRFGNGLKRDY